MSKLLLILLLPGFTLFSQTPDVIARQFIELLAKRDFANAVGYFDAASKEIVSASQIEGAWKAVIAQLGPFSKQLGVRTETMGTVNLVYVDCQFEKKTLSIKVVLNEKHKIVGFFLVPTYTSVEAKRPESVIEERLDVSDLAGILARPKEGGGPFPALVLVHGSGPNDKDETFGPNKPFRDLAWGLAERGIAVLRYDKRTKIHPEQFRGSFTVKEETLDDALAGVNLLRATAWINSKRIYVLGHSLGGMLIPRIGKADPNITGLIVMAGTTRPLEDVIVEQMRYLGGNVTAAKTQADKIKSLKPGDGPVEGAPASYWLDLRGYNPPEVAKQLTQPILILQGQRDYQVTMTDFAGWKNALTSRPNVTFKTYAALNHMFLAGEGKSSPAEYEKPGRVPETVIDDISGWIKVH